MLAKLRIVYLAHSLTSDWNNGNAHFLRGLMRELSAVGNSVTIFEAANGWSLTHLRTEDAGERSLQDFKQAYSELDIQTYTQSDEIEMWRERLYNCHVVIVHEWNDPALVQQVLQLAPEMGFRTLFHDTHHRALSSPDSIRAFQPERFDGVILFGEALRAVYRSRFDVTRAWTLHEAADTSVFFPRPSFNPMVDVVWIGNWGDSERVRELGEYLLAPALELKPDVLFNVYGVRYPSDGLRALQAAEIIYGGYLPNLDAPKVYSLAAITLHIPRRQYSEMLPGIPTIRVFEALASGIPLVSAPWQDTESLFEPDDFIFVHSSSEMGQAIKILLHEPERATALSHKGLATILERHTCRHRAVELTKICADLI